MKKTGNMLMENVRGNGKFRKCANCGGIGIRRVTFEDCFAKVVLILCEVCSRKEYEDLHLQSPIPFRGGK